MEERIKFFVGLNAHKNSISIAAYEAGREPARFVGTIGPDVQGLFKVLAKAGTPAQVSVVYEAGLTEYGLYRELLHRGYWCEIIAPTHRHRGRHRAGGRDRRHRPLRHGPPIDGLPRARAERTLDRRQHSPRLDHQDGQLARQAAVDRSGVELPLSRTPDGHFKFPHLWPVNFPQAGRAAL
jgi:hypothetical protein